MRYRAFALAFALTLPPLVLLGPSAPLEGLRTAEAGVAVFLSLDELVAASSYVVVATPGDQHSAWEDMPSGRRIVTYTRLQVHDAIVGAPGTEIWVRTLGGAVDRIGQAVNGEARLVPGARAMFFLTNAAGTVAVTALAQGHYPVVAGDTQGAPERLAGSPDPGMLVPRRGPVTTAHQQLVGATLADAKTAVLRARRGHDEKK